MVAMPEVEVARVELMLFSTVKNVRMAVVNLDRIVQALQKKQVVLAIAQVLIRILYFTRRVKIEKNTWRHER